MVLGKTEKDEEQPHRELSGKSSKETGAPGNIALNSTKLADWKRVAGWGPIRPAPGDKFVYGTEIVPVSKMDGIVVKRGRFNLAGKLECDEYREECFTISREPIREKKTT